MPGFLRVLPGAASRHRPRTLRLNRVPAPALLEDLVGGPLHPIDGLDSLRVRGALHTCLAFQAGDGEGVNVAADFLRMQSELRQYGFSGSQSQTPIRGTIVALAGDEEFVDAIALAVALDGWPPAETFGRRARV